MISWWWLLGGLLAVVVAAWLSLATLLFLASSSPSANERAKLRFDAVKTSLTVGAGAAGLIALVLGFRRQWLSERAQSHLEYDSREQRITDLYTKAADQLGNEKAAVRLAGLYALERVAQGNPEHRQTVVDVMCAYLRMPQPAGSDQPADDVDDGSVGQGKQSSGVPQRSTEFEEERHVRLAAQEIILKHLKRHDSDGEVEDSFWPDIDLNLSGAYLRYFELVDCELRKADFSGVIFAGGLDVIRTTFQGMPWGTRGPYGVGGAGFDSCVVEGRLVFEDVNFCGDSTFNGAIFRGDFYMGGMTFAGEAEFSEAIFEDDCHFEAVTFEDAASFKRAEFRQGLTFNRPIIYVVGTTFNGLETRFENAIFTGAVDFGNVIFNGKPISDSATPNGVNFEGARARASAEHARVWPEGWTEQEAATDGFGSLVPTSSRQQEDASGEPSTQEGED